MTAKRLNPDATTTPTRVTLATANQELSNNCRTDGAGEVWYVHVGYLCTAYAYGLVIDESAGVSVEIIKGFPRPKSTPSWITQDIADPTHFRRIGIDSNGILKIWWTAPKGTVSTTFAMTYITAEPSWA